MVVAVPAVGAVISVAGADVTLVTLMVFPMDGEIMDGVTIVAGAAVAVHVVEAGVEISADGAVAVANCSI